MKILLVLFLLSSTALGQLATGWKSNPRHAKSLKQFVHTGLTVIQPSSDLTSKLPPVYNQGEQGSCTAQAGVAAFEVAWYQQHKKFLQGSRQGLYMCELIHDGTWPEDAGSYTSSILWVLKNQGLGLERCLPYQEKPCPLPRCYLKEAAKHKVLTAYDVDSSDGKSIRIALTNGFPVIFGGYVYNDIMNLQAPYILPSPKGRPIGGHEMLIVGHNDAKKLYKVRNSWGALWGDKGYLYIKYADMHNLRIYEDFAVLSLTN